MKSITGLLKYLHLVIIAMSSWECFDFASRSEDEIKALNSEVQTLQVKLSKNEKKLKEIDKFKANLAASQARVDEVIKQIERVQKQLPQDVNDSVVQQIMQTISDKVKVKDSNPRPGKEENRGFYFAKEYLYSAKGTFLQFLIFFENLEKEERILNVKSLNLTYDQDEPPSRFQVLKLNAAIESFKYNKDHNEKANL